LRDMARELLEKALAAHGGLARWSCFATGGQLHEGDELWRGLRLTYPQNIASHGKKQVLLRRHDYHVEASGGFAAAQYVFDPVTIQGITLPTKRRAYMRDSVSSHWVTV
jgi:hypothetical protein